MTKLLAHNHQGNYDPNKKPLTLRDNALRLEKYEVLDAVQVRFKKVEPKIYQRLDAPLFKRHRDELFDRYRNSPKSLEGICKDVCAEEVPIDALVCDDCLNEDLSPTWGYYGYTATIVPNNAWSQLCGQRANVKFVRKGGRSYVPTV